MKYIFSLLAIAAIIIALPAAGSAQSFDLFKNVCENAPTGSESPACEDRVGDSTDPNQNPIYGPNGIIIKAVNIISMVVGVAAIIGIMYAGFKYITSGSNSQDVTDARELIIYALIGLVVAATAQLAVRFILFNSGLV